MNSSWMKGVRMKIWIPLMRWYASCGIEVYQSLEIFSCQAEEKMRIRIHLGLLTWE